MDHVSATVALGAVVLTGVAVLAASGEIARMLKVRDPKVPATNLPQL
jgi:hypothetical protein